MARIPQSRNVVAVFQRGQKRLTIPARGRVIDLVCDKLTTDEQKDLVGVLQNGKWID